jgi:hypothetical protein
MLARLTRAIEAIRADRKELTREDESDPAARACSRADLQSDSERVIRFPRVDVSVALRTYDFIRDKPEKGRGHWYALQCDRGSQ